MRSVIVISGHSRLLRHVAAINTGATPVFVDVDRDSMGLSPSALTSFLESCAENGPWERLIKSRRISGCVPMHTLVSLAE